MDFLKEIVGRILGIFRGLFRLRGRPLKHDEGLIIKLICRACNYDLSQSLVGHQYVGQLNNEENGC